MSLISHLRTAVRKRAAYNRTLHELRSIPASIAEDIGINPGDEKRVATRAIYG